MAYPDFERSRYKQEVMNHNLTHSHGHTKKRRREERKEHKKKRKKSRNAESSSDHGSSGANGVHFGLIPKWVLKIPDHSL